MFKDILLPVDLGDRESQQKAVKAAVEFAKAFGSRLHVLTIVPDFGMSIVGGFFPKNFEEEALEEANKQLHAFVAEVVPSDVKVQHIVAHGTIYEQILHFARETKVDLIVMASHRPELQDYLLGPNAARVVRHANCSVTVVRD
ncbi:universal stress protein [Pelagibius litoralis]|uniref:Universal stress protein n=1 Tax=Pelagibius litoralis TaxID=374515 RepID=A0A967KGA9_9PROT|nr:universal stress protein [Pelagibius litoralis]NIA70201.1 universal stress protein [Pelagibius litoralis]